jgi:hypothetical protein
MRKKRKEGKAPLFKVSSHSSNKEATTNTELEIGFLWGILKQKEF